MVRVHQSEILEVRVWFEFRKKNCRYRFLIRVRFDALVINDTKVTAILRGLGVAKAANAHKSSIKYKIVSKR